MSPFTSQLRDKCQKVFESWVTFQQSDDLEEAKLILLQISEELKEPMGDPEITSREAIKSDRGPKELYAMLGSARGLVEAMTNMQKAFRQINWSQ